MTSFTSFASFGEVAAHLDRLGMFRIRPELGRLRTVLDRLEPAIAAAGRPKAAIQIAGTNGKGSTATFLAAIARAHGLRTGLFTSPHFVSFRERIRFNGVPVAEDAVLAPANQILAAGGAKLTYFEFVTALAACMFTAQHVDFAVFETGLGGTWDATTALPVDAVVYTPISLDHCRILGDTVAAIACDKAGAMRPDLPVFTAPQHDEAMRVLEAEAHKRGCAFTVAAPTPDNTPLGLDGDHQRVNAGTALAVWRSLAAQNGWAVSADHERKGLASAFIPGRMQWVPASAEHGHPALLLDGAHNGHGLAALGKTLGKRGIAPSAVIFSCLEDKNPADMATHLRVLATGPIFVPPISNNPRALAPSEITRIIGLAAYPEPDMGAALRSAAQHIADYMDDAVAARPDHHPVLVCGSLYMLGDFFSLRPDCLEG